LKYIVEYNTFRHDLRPINESLAVGLVTDALQFMIGAAAEYGIAAASIGIGTPVALAVETIVDVGFAAGIIASSIKQVTELKGQFDKFVDTINKCMASFEIFKSGDFDTFYSTVKQTMIEGIDLIKGEETVDKLAEKLRDIISSLISKITDAVAKSLKVLIPDATTGLALSTAIKVVVETVSDKGYTIATTAVEKLGEYKKYLIDPDEFPKLLEQTFPEVYKLIDGFKKKIAETGWTKSIVMFGASGLILKKMGPSGLDKLTATIKKFEPIVMDLVKKILSIVIPVTFTLLAIIQILLKGEYKSDEKETKSDEKETKSDAKAEGQDDLVNTLKNVKTKNPEAIKKLDDIANIYQDPDKNKDKIAEIDKLIGGEEGKGISPIKAY
jgi:hypothetical protein